MLELLLFGLPSDALGGLALTILLFVVSAVVALLLGYVYAAAIVQYPLFGIVLLFISSVIRGIPLLLLVFIASYLPNVSTVLCGMLGLILYSLSHVTEIQRGFLSKHPESLRRQTRAMGIDWFQD